MPERRRAAQHAVRLRKFLNDMRLKLDVHHNFLISWINMSLHCDGVDKNMKPADQGLIGADGDAEVQAANDDHGPMHGAHESASATTATGWDAFEVWRSRVRDPRRAASRTFPE